MKPQKDLKIYPLLLMHWKRNLGDIMIKNILQEVESDQNDYVSAARWTCIKMDSFMAILNVRMIFF
jgi:hypothetical protein